MNTVQYRSDVLANSVLEVHNGAQDCRSRFEQLPQSGTKHMPVASNVQCMYRSNTTIFIDRI